MNFTSVRKELKAAGTEQNRKVYARHGVGRRMYGVSFANLKRIAKLVGRNHTLASKLWATGNHDARVLATMVAEPTQARSSHLDAWARDLDNYVVSDALASFVARTDFLQAKAEKWMRSRSEFISQAGYDLLSTLASRDNGLPAAYFDEQLKVIEAKIHNSPNRTRHAMNTALISIGVRSVGLKRRAVATARRIGKVEVDHGETSCKTQDAIAYIDKVLAYRAKKARK